MYKNYYKADIDSEKADIDNLQIYDAVMKKFSIKTIEHVKKLYVTLGTDEVFGRTDVQDITKLGHTRASELLRELVEEQIIITVFGYGKGKYRFCKKYS